MRTTSPDVRNPRVRSPCGERWGSGGAARSTRGCGRRRASCTVPEGKRWGGRAGHSPMVFAALVACTVSEGRRWGGEPASQVSWVRPGRRAPCPRGGSGAAASTRPDRWAVRVQPCTVSQGRRWGGELRASRPSTIHTGSYTVSEGRQWGGMVVVALTESEHAVYCFHERWWGGSTRRSSKGDDGAASPGTFAACPRVGGGAASVRTNSCSGTLFASGRRR